METFRKLQPFTKNIPSLFRKKNIHLYPFLYLHFLSLFAGLLFKLYIVDITVDEIKKQVTKIDIKPADWQRLFELTATFSDFAVLFP